MQRHRINEINSHIEGKAVLGVVNPSVIVGTIGLTGEVAQDLYAAYRTLVFLCVGIVFIMDRLAILGERFFKPDDVTTQVVAALADLDGAAFGVIIPKAGFRRGALFPVGLIAR